MFDDVIDPLWHASAGERESRETCVEHMTAAAVTAAYPVLLLLAHTHTLVCTSTSTSTAAQGAFSSGAEAGAGTRTRHLTCLGILTASPTLVHAYFTAKSHFSLQGERERECSSECRERR